MKRLKRESRTAYVEYIKEGGGMALAFVFRGGWIDAIVMTREIKSPKELVNWLKEAGYYEELSGIALGEGMRRILGGQGSDEIGLGLPIVEICSRNRIQADVIIDGIRQWLIQMRGSLPIS